MFPESDEVLAKFTGVKPPCCEEMKRTLPISMVFLAFCSVSFCQGTFFNCNNWSSFLQSCNCHLILHLTNIPTSSTLMAMEDKKLVLGIGA